MKQKRKEARLNARIKEYTQSKNNTGIPDKVRRTYRKPGSMRK